MQGLSKERFLWTCELNKDQPSKVWKASDLTQEDDDDDFILHTLVVKTAVLGAAAVDNERNLIALKTKEADKEIDQPLFSLTLGKQDCVTNMDLEIATRGKDPVEFRLISGTGPVFITCMHLIEMPDSGMMGDDEMMGESDEDEEDDDDEKEAPKAGKSSGVKASNAHKNGGPKPSGSGEGAKKRKRN